MAVYDLEEQDKLDDLKAWWHQWGNTITTIVAVACVALAGVQGWRWWTAKQAEEASAVYAGLAQAARANDLAKAKDAAAALEDRFARTGYAPRGALVLAKLLFDSGDTAGARAQLQWVIDRADETELKEIARYRLAELRTQIACQEDVLTITLPEGLRFLYPALRLPLWLWRHSILHRGSHHPTARQARFD